MTRKNHSILIVDDNPQNLQVLGKLLQEGDYDVEFATNGTAALDWLGSKQFDLVLLDINMPGMDGFEVCRKIRSNVSLLTLPVIFLSADNDRESILKGFELGGQDYVTKPFDSRELIVRVKTHITLKESLENLEKLNKSLEEKVKERTLQLKIANENLEIKNKQLLDLDNAKSEFLNLISHEIRTPLNGILLPLELLKDPVKPTEWNELVEILDQSVKRLEKFSMNALLITRLKTRPFDIEKKDVLLENVVNEVLNEADSLLKAKGLKINKNTALKGKILGEPELVKKCIFNIIDNAIAFSPVNGQIGISLVKEDNFFVLKIDDWGKGIPDAILEKGSEILTRGKDYADKSIGTGLSLSKLIMEAHNGEMKLSNKKNGGALVSLNFR